MTSKLFDLPIKNIRFGNRHRKDMGALQELADSIKEEGLLQAIGVTHDMELVFGERRLRACRDILKWKTIPARVVDVTSIVAGEYAENEVRKDFTVSERLAIAATLEDQLGERRGNSAIRQKIDQLKGRTDDLLAEKTGFGNRQTFRQAKKVVANGTEKLILAMDDGKVSIAAAALLADVSPDEQDIILDLDEKAILKAAKEIKERQAEKRAEYQESKTPKPIIRPKKERLAATRLIHGDCRDELKKLPEKSVDFIPIDPPYPEIDREYGRYTEEEWHELMRVVVIEGRRILKPQGSMVIILQSNFEKLGKTRLWLWEFIAWAGREWNLVQDVYWWNFGAMPTHACSRKYQLLRPSVKMCVWLGAPDCYRNQDAVLWLPSDDNFAETKSGAALRTNRSGHQYRMSRITEAVEERGGLSPFNLIPITGNGSTGLKNAHPATTPYDLAAWWVKYLLPPNGVLLDCFAGSGTMLAAGLDFGASQVIGIEREKKYLKMAEERLLTG